MFNYIFKAQHIKNLSSLFLLQKQICLTQFSSPKDVFYSLHSLAAHCYKHQERSRIFPQLDHQCKPYSRLYFYHLTFLDVSTDIQPVYFLYFYSIVYIVGIWTIPFLSSSSTCLTVKAQSLPSNLHGRYFSFSVNLESLSLRIFWSVQSLIFSV